MNWLARLGWIGIGWSLHKLLDTEAGKQIKEDIGNSWRGYTKKKAEDKGEE